MAETEPKPRRYKRITEEDGARARALWATGAATLEEIAAEIGVSTRAVQMHLKAHGVAKGSLAETMASKIRAEVITAEFGEKEERIEKGKASRAASYTLADQIERCVGVILAQIVDDPASAFRFSAPLKALDIAAATIERTGKQKLAALGLDSADNLQPLPEIVIRDLTDEECAQMQRQHEDADA